MRLRLKEAKPKENPTLSEFMMQEAEATFRMFRNDLEKVKSSMAIRNKEIEVLNKEHLVDIQNKLRIEGALSVCNHLVTKYKEAWMKERGKVRSKKKDDVTHE